MGKITSIKLTDANPPKYYSFTVTTAKVGIYLFDDISYEVRQFFL